SDSPVRTVPRRIAPTPVATLRRARARRSKCASCAIRNAGFQRPRNDSTSRRPQMQESVSFTSAGLRLSGVLHLPDDYVRGERRPAIVVMHGFGSSKDAGNVMEPVKLFTSWGYAALRFDFRGCGDSDGEFGRIICLEEVEDAGDAVAYLASRPEIDPR